MVQATLTYIGRLLALEPAELGRLFEDELAITLRVQQSPTIDNGFRSDVIEVPQVMWWYATHPTSGLQVFNSFSGYGHRIATKLRKLGHQVTEQDIMPCGLPAPDFSKIDGVTFRGEQQQVLISMLVARSGVVVCPTGWGKSFLLRLIAKLYPTAVIIFTVPSIEIAREIYEAVKEHDSTIGFVGDGRRDVQRVTVAVTHSLRYCRKDANLLIGDEAHALVASDFREQLVEFTRAKFIGMTATDEGRSDDGDQYIEALFGPTIARIPYQDAVESGNVVPLKVWVFQSNHGFNVSQIQNKAYKDKHGLWMNDSRNQLIAHSIRYAEQRLPQEIGIAAADLQILIMVTTAEHAYRLQQVLPDFTVVTGAPDKERIDELKEMKAMTASQVICTPKDRKRLKKEFSDGTLKRVIATKVWAKGVNFQDLNVLARADGTASMIDSGQIPGRLSRLGSERDKGVAYLIDYNDTFSPDMQGRSKSRFQVYRANRWAIEAIM